MTRAAEPPRDLHRARWDGTPGRLEVWYATATDAATGTGLWLHHEVVAPTDGSPAYGHGWAVLFPVGRPPVCERFGPQPVSAGATQFAMAGLTVAPGRLCGKAGRLSWDLAVQGGSDPLYTFPRMAWRRELLPAAQLVPRPTARLRGRVGVDGRELDVDGPGATARIYGHGNAERWVWLHADLGGGDVLEVVSAVSRRSGMRRLRPLPFVQLRVGGQDWPRHPLAAAALFRAEPALPDWSLRGVAGRHRLTVEVRLDPASSVVLTYRDPDGSPAVCTNSERASAVVVLERRQAWRWTVRRRWHLDGTAHAEVGMR